MTSLQPASVIRPLTSSLPAQPELYRKQQKKKTWQSYWAIFILYSKLLKTPKVTEQRVKLQPAKMLLDLVWGCKVCRLSLAGNQPESEGPVLLCKHHRGRKEIKMFQTDRGAGRLRAFQRCEETNLCLLSQTDWFFQELTITVITEMSQITSQFS